MMGLVVFQATKNLNGDHVISCFNMIYRFKTLHPSWYELETISNAAKAQYGYENVVVINVIPIMDDIKKKGGESNGSRCER